MDKIRKKLPSLRDLTNFIGRWTRQFQGRFQKVKQYLT